MKKSFDKHQKTWIIAGTIIIVALIAMYTIFQLSPSQTISSNGQATIEVIPDQVSMNFLIETEANTASEASDSNTEKYNNFISSLTSLGIDEEEIKTTNINVRKNYEWINGRQVDRGYIATHNVKIELGSNELDQISPIIDAGVSSDSLITYVNFELSDSLEEEKKAEAIQEATENARIKAESIAEGLNARLGNIVSVSDSNTYYNPPYVYYAEENVKDAETSGASAQVAVADINPSEQTIQANVRVVYKIR